MSEAIDSSSQAIEKLKRFSLLHWPPLPWPHGHMAHTPPAFCRENWAGSVHLEKTHDAVQAPEKHGPDSPDLTRMRGGSPQAFQSTFHLFVKPRLVGNVVQESIIIQVRHRSHETTFVEF